MVEEHHYYVYMMASRSHVLYVGVTNSVQRRTEEHLEAEGPGFTGDYRCNRLVWFEHYRISGMRLVGRNRSNVGDVRRRYGLSSRRILPGPI
jgi:hypothetical protein